MNVLVINCGSSSLKFSVVDTLTGTDLARGLFDQLGSNGPAYQLESRFLPEPRKDTLPQKAAHHTA